MKKENNLVNKKIFLLGIFLVLTLSFVLADYSVSTPQLTKPGLNSANYNYGTSVTLSVLDENRCEKGQDFILQVAPFGCTPAVVRSDLLEEQNVPVFCQLAATQVNPLIDVNAINYISFKGDMPEGITGVGFHPARAALDTTGSTLLNSPVLENVGYAVIVLEKQKNESSMPDSISGTLTASIKYDLQNTFGVGKASYYLPEFTPDEWATKFTQYEFWRNKGYLRADSISENSATVSVYSNENNKIATTTLSKGQTSSQINLPGFYCLAGLQVRLDDLENPDTRAKFNVNGEIIEVGDEEQFLENRCILKELDKKGLVQETTVRCKGDEKTEDFNFKISPRVNLQVGDSIKDYGIGEYVFTDDDGKPVYLAYIGTKKDSEKVEDVYVWFMEKPSQTNVLSEKELEDASKFDGYFRLPDFGNVVVDVFASGAKALVGTAVAVKNILGDGKYFNKLNYDGTSLNTEGTSISSYTAFGKSVRIIGFADPMNIVLEGDALRNYDLAMEDYRMIIDSFPNAQEILSNTTEQKIVDSETFGEQAFFKAIQLAKKTEQKKTMLSLCYEFKEKFPKSETIIPECDNPYKNSNEGLSTETISVNSEVKSISFEGIYEPSIEDFSAVVRVKNASGSQEQYTLVKDTRIYLNENTDNFIELVDLENNYATVRINLKAEGVGSAIGKAVSLDRFRLNLNEGVGQGGFVFTVTDIKLKKVAKVSVLPKVDNAGTETNFSFNIGIEKRAIQLAPDEIEDRIDDLENLIEDWTKISSDLGDTVKTFNAACLSTGILLTAKNFFDNSGGKSIARNKVMRSEGGWTDICKKALSTGKLNGETVSYSSLDDCFLENSDKIDRDVETYYESIQDISVTQENKDTQTALLAKSLGTTVKNPENSNEEIDTKNIITAFNYEGENNTLRLSQVRDLKSIENALANNPSDELKTVLEIQRYKLLSDINVNVEAQVTEKSFVDRLNAQSGLTGVTVKSYGDKNIINAVYEGGKTTSTGFGEIGANANVQGIAYKNQQYLINLTKLSGKEYQIVNIFDANGNRLLENSAEVEFDKQHRYDANAAEIRSKFSFVEFDKATYQNKFKNAEVKYFETEPYKGMAAQVPFDLENGWYVAMKQTLPTGGAIQTYDASGAVSSFYLCNVGENGKAEFNFGGGDICRGYNPGTGRVVSSFSGLSPSEEARLVSCAIDAINDANKAYNSGVTRAGISTSCGGSINLNVGNPEVGVPEMQCQDFMSPKDCNLLFNVCDPVVCPSSRCNLGGTYYSSDVIQSGIIGSIALCLPNFKENIFVPICLSGLKAGIDNLLSMFEGYRDCLQTQLDSGETVGVCDELHSIYLCEFFWREALPFAQTIIPRIFESLLGQDDGSRGGGEYLGVQSAWDNAQNSVDYMSNYYGRDITNAFKVKIGEEVGGAVCKNFVSANYPEGGDVLDSLVEPDSPPQYTANFEEIPFTTATVPATSQYKVFYHIYAGANSKAYYQVYLKTPSGTSLYQTAPSITVATGFIAAGDYAEETKDFTAATGYKELCISINGEETCGFGKVSTSFAVNYLNDLYLQEQAGQTDIKSETDCISGTSSVYSLAQPNLQEGLGDVVSPSLYDSGIIRVCATSSPGKGTDVNWNNQNARWQQVGTCDGEVGELKCFLDTSSVKDTIKTTSIENETLGDVSKNYVDKLLDEGGYLDFSKTITEIDNLDNSGKTSYITGTLIGKAFFNYQKAKLYLIRGNAYGDLAKTLYDVIKKTSATGTGQSLGAGQVTGLQTCKEQYFGQCDVAGRLITLANIAKNKNGIDDATVRADTEADCFEELVLMQAMQESGVKHCEGDFTNDLTCDGNLDSVLKSKRDEKSFGVMQINTDVHKDVNAQDFDSNANYGIDLLISNYNTETKEYECGNTIYSGWKRALRYYNGWNTDCTKGDVGYVENVIGRKALVESLFGNVCGSVTVSQTVDKIEYPIFEYQDGTPSSNIFLTFTGSEWVWGLNEFSVRNVGGESIGEDAGSWRVSSSNENLLSRLRGKNYEQGLQLLLNEVINSKSNFVDLVTTNVAFSYERTFIVTVDGENIRLQNDGTSWRYSIGGTTWNTDLINSKYDITKSVDGKTLLEGAKIIFDVDKEEILSNSVVENAQQLNEGELEVVANAKSCEDCGEGWFNNCDETECLAINQVLGGDACEWVISTFPFYNCFEIPEKYTAQKALDKINDDKLSGSYYDNKEFFDKLLSDGVITFDEHNSITLLYDENDINELKVLLQEKIGVTVEPEDTYVETNVWTYDSAIDKVSELLKRWGNVKYSYNYDIKTFIDELCSQNLISSDDCKDIKGGALTNWEEDLEFVQDAILRQQINTGDFPITIEE